MMKPTNRDDQGVSRRREIAAGSKLLGSSIWKEFSAAPAQIRVSFDIDANGILHVGAKDKGTGKKTRSPSKPIPD